jgi:hypothetical protein
LLNRKICRFDGAYDSDSQQEQLFHNEIEPMIGSVFKGIHTTIFAYGITGAGTHSRRLTHTHTLLSALVWLPCSLTGASLTTGTGTGA